ncbi:alpha/beta fold hydrolase [Streptosporangium canum]|uniref:alpha/beta fold hydrolase n=1 Tax=Streptosporangium canum TaxID=324952 RepID=UPI0034286ED6
MGRRVSGTSPKWSTSCRRPARRRAVPSVPRSGGSTPRTSPTSRSAPDPADSGRWRTRGRRSYERHPGTPEGDARQRAAVAVSGDRRKALAKVRIPTLVLHGEDDPVIRLKAGQATAAAIPGARLVTYPGMGHDLPRALWPSMLGQTRSLALTR